jgi:hypothetical protein
LNEPVRGDARARAGTASREAAQPAAQAL